MIQAFALSFLIAAAMIGCANTHNHIDPSFQPIYDTFIDMARRAGIALDKDQGLTIQFGDPGAARAGQCSKIGYGNATIEISRDTWQSSPPGVQWIILFHELGHSALGEGHTSDPNAIMNPNLAVSRWYADSSMGAMVSRLFRDMGDASH